MSERSLAARRYPNGRCVRIPDARLAVFINEVCARDALAVELARQGVSNVDVDRLAVALETRGDVRWDVGRGEQDE